MGSGAGLARSFSLRPSTSSSFGPSGPWRYPEDFPTQKNPFQSCLQFPAKQQEHLSFVPVTPSRPARYTVSSLGTAPAALCLNISSNPSSPLKSSSLSSPSSSALASRWLISLRARYPSTASAAPSPSGPLPSLPARLPPSPGAGVPDSLSVPVDSLLNKGCGACALVRRGGGGMLRSASPGVALASRGASEPRMEGVSEPAWPRVKMEPWRP